MGSLWCQVSFYSHALFWSFFFGKPFKENIDLGIQNWLNYDFQSICLSNFYDLFFRLILPFFGYWPMDYLFITRIWILLWSCMWACDFLDFSWTLFIFPSVKGEDYSHILQTICFICYEPYHMTHMVFMIFSIFYFITWRCVSCEKTWKWNV